MHVAADLAAVHSAWQAGETEPAPAEGVGEAEGTVVHIVPVRALEAVQQQDARVQEEVRRACVPPAVPPSLTARCRRPTRAALPARPDQGSARAGGCHHQARGTGARHCRAGGADAAAVLAVAAGAAAAADPHRRLHSRR